MKDTHIDIEIAIATALICLSVITLIVFMRLAKPVKEISSTNITYDLNGDGKVNLQDVSIEASKVQ